MPTDDAVQAARKRGHTPEPDPPAALSAVLRWTCHCGATVLDYHGRIYGGAVEEDCRPTFPPDRVFPPDRIGLVLDE